MFADDIFLRGGKEVDVKAPLNACRKLLEGSEGVRV